jgi:Alcohol dehydrogenase, class IV
MAASTFYIPPVNVIGTGSVTEAMNAIHEYGYRRALIVTDAMLNKLGMAGEVQKGITGTGYFQRGV